MILLLALLACNPGSDDTATVDHWTAPDAPGHWITSTDDYEHTGSTGVDFNTTRFITAFWIAP